MRTNFLGPAAASGLALLAVFTAGCHSKAPQPQPQPLPAREQAMAKCGAIPPGLSGAVVAGTDNEFFTATSRQSIKIKQGVQTASKAGPDGKPHTLILTSKARSQAFPCSCPGGCDRPGPYGCILVQTPDVAYCEGDCEMETGCCLGCGFWFGP